MILWIAFILLEVYRNYVLIEVLELRPNYSWSHVIRFFAGFAWLLYMVPGFDPLGNYLTLWQAFPVVVFSVSSFYLLFDVLLNCARGNHWNYKGKHSGYFDGLGMKWYYTLKAMSAVAMALSLINLYGKV